MELRIGCTVLFSGGKYHGIVTQMLEDGMLEVCSPYVGTYLVKRSECRPVDDKNLLEILTPVEGSSWMTHKNLIEASRYATQIRKRSKQKGGGHLKKAPVF